MGKLTQKIKENFDSQSSRKIWVPEWEQEIYIWPETIGQRMQWDDDSLGSVFNKMIMCVRVRAKDSDGQHIFDDRDVETLKMKGSGIFGPAVITRIALEIQKDDPTEEDIKKNSEPQE